MVIAGKTKTDGDGVRESSLQRRHHQREGRRKITLSCSLAKIMQTSWCEHTGQRNRAETPQRATQYGHLIVLVFTIAQKPFNGAKRHVSTDGAGPAANPRFKARKGNLISVSHLTGRKIKIVCGHRSGYENLRQLTEERMH